MKLFSLNLFICLYLTNLISINCFYVNKVKCINNINCKLPHCHCDSDEIPLNLTNKFRLDRLPQLVILTIDDYKLDYKSFQTYKKLFESFNNPNGCPIKATFFLSDPHNKTSYCLIRNLYENGHEIALSTLNYECPHSLCNPNSTFEPWDFKQWTKEILSMRKRLELFSAIPRSQLNGFRAPMMEPSSNVHYRVISSHNFLYDSSLIINHDKVLWPFTLNYQTEHPVSNNAPTESFTNLWELPVHVYFDTEGNACLKIWEGHCKFDNSAHGVARFLRSNFLRSYYSNRAPYVINLLNDWLQIQTEPDFMNKAPFRSVKNVTKKQYKNLEGVIRFINETLKHNNDVYFVTANEAIRYMKQLPYLALHANKSLNLTQYLHDQILHSNSDDDDTKSCIKAKYDGLCKSLKFYEVDYNTTDALVDIDPNEDAKLDIDKILIELQSEFLFLNGVIEYFIIFLAIFLIIIYIYDKMH